MKGAKGGHRACCKGQANNGCRGAGGGKHWEVVLATLPFFLFSLSRYLSVTFVLGQHSN